MQHLHRDFQGGPGVVVQVELSHQANVMLLDSGNYAAYRAGRAFRYHGGLMDRSPVRLSPPHAGKWHVVVDLGGGGGRIRASIQLFGVAC